MRTVCVCDPCARRWYIPGGYRRSTPDLEQYIQSRLEQADKYGPDDLSMDHLKRVVENYPVGDLGSIREVFEQTMPLKVTSCRCTTLCCGTCTHKCMYRCVQDLLHKLYFASFQYEEIYDALFVQSRRKKSTYKSLCTLCNRLLDERKIRNVPRDVEDYSSSMQIDWETMSPVVDESTGSIVRIPWPYSGMCPFCLSEQQTRVRGSRNFRKCNL